MTSNLSWVDEFFTGGSSTEGENIGGEAEVFKDKDGATLRMRTLKAGSNVTITQNANDITFDATGDLTGTVSVADDIAKSGPSDIDRVVGIRGIAIAGADAAAPPIGGTQVYNEQGTNSYKQKKPVMPGHYDVRDYGGVPDYVYGDPGPFTDNLDAFNACLAAMAAEGDGIKDSIHSYRGAADIVDGRQWALGKDPWTTTAAFWNALGQEAEALGLTWGGRFSKVDKPHVQWPTVQQQYAFRAMTDAQRRQAVA